MINMNDNNLVLFKLKNGNLIECKKENVVLINDIYFLFFEFYIECFLQNELEEIKFI